MRVGSLAPGGLNQARGFVLPEPAIGQALGFRHRGEQFGVQEFIPEPGVERLVNAVLP